MGQLANCLINSSALQTTPRMWNVIFVDLYGYIRLLTQICFDTDNIVPFENTTTINQNKKGQNKRT